MGGRAGSRDGDSENVRKRLRPPGSKKTAPKQPRLLKSKADKVVPALATALTAVGLGLPCPPTPPAAPSGPLGRDLHRVPRLSFTPKHQHLPFIANFSS